jgi:hypothetical protein
LERRQRGGRPPLARCVAPADLDAGAATVSALTAARRTWTARTMKKSRFLLWLAPRIRRLEIDTAKCLVGRLEGLLVQVRQLAEKERDDDDADFLLTVAACLRALALLSRGSVAGSIMPLLRAQLSMGRLDALGCGGRAPAEASGSMGGGGGMGGGYDRLRWSGRWLRHGRGGHGRSGWCQGRDGQRLRRRRLALPEGRSPAHRRRVPPRPGPPLAGV